MPDAGCVSEGSSIAGQGPGRATLRRCFAGLGCEVSGLGLVAASCRSWVGVWEDLQRREAEIKERTSTDCQNRSCYGQVQEVLESFVWLYGVCSGFRVVFFFPALSLGFVA